MAIHSDSSCLCSRCSCSIIPPTPIPWPPHITHNRPAGTLPSPAEKSALLSFISDAEARLSLYDAETTRLAAFTRNMESERLQMIRAVDECRSLLAPAQPHVELHPIHGLPIELLREIFQVCSDDCNSWLKNPEEAEEPEAPEKSACLAPMNLGLVCKLWRDIVLSTPSLWSTIAVTLDDVTERTAGLVELFLERSRELPLGVTVIHTWEGWQHPLEYCVVRSIAKNMHRIRLLKMVGDVSLFWELESLEDWMFLETLILDDHIRETLGERSLFKNAPRLKSLRLFDGYELPELVEPHLPFEQITFLEARYAKPVEEVMQAMERFPNLEHVTLDITSWPSRDWRVHSEYLATVNLTVVPVSDMGYPHDPGEALQRFFTCATLPSLTSLTIASEPSGHHPVCDGWGVYTHDAFLKMLSRSHFALENLSLENIEIPDSKLLDVFRLSPSLTKLSIRERDDRSASRTVTADFIRQLITPPSSDNDSLSSGILLPKLKRLEFGLASSFTDYELLADLIEFRSTRLSDLLSDNHGACLEEIILAFAAPIGQDIRTRLRNLARNELRLWIS